eukprot:scaffold8777_cov297-Ochromonas_danica.AAC.1
MTTAGPLVRYNYKAWRGTERLPHFCSFVVLDFRCCNTAVDKLSVINVFFAKAPCRPGSVRHPSAVGSSLCLLALMSISDQN